MLQPSDSRRLEDAQGVFLVEDLFELVAALEGPHGLDIVLGLAGLVALLGALFQSPAEAGGEAGGANHAEGSSMKP